MKPDVAIKLLNLAKQTAKSLNITNFNLDIKDILRAIQPRITILNALEKAWQYTFQNEKTLEIEQKYSALQSLLKQWHQLTHQNETYQLFPDLFSRIAEQYSDSVAIQYYDKQLTYRELEQEVIVLSKKLLVEKQKHHWENGTAIGIFFENCPESIISILAIMKAGLSYLAITPDPQLSEEHLANCLEHAKVKLLLTQEDEESRPSIAPYIRHFNELKKSNRADYEIYPYHQFKTKIDETELSDISFPELKPDDHAYTIFSSGTSGKPKGIKIAHRGLVLPVQAVKETLNVQPGDKVGWYSSLVFDASFLDIMTALGTGATSIIVPSKIRQDIKELHEYLFTQEIAIITLVPKVLDALMPMLRIKNKLQCCIVTGEAASIELFNNAHKVGIRMFNGHGPSETTICDGLGEYISDMKTEVPIVIIKGMKGFICKLVDSLQEPNPLIPNLSEKNEEGELYLTGPAVGLGYINNEEVNAKKFRYIVHPETDEVLFVYQTRDLFRRRANQLCYVDRLDDQIKYMGEAIQPGPIRQAILNLTDSSNQKVIAEAIIKSVNSQPITAYLKMQPGKVLNQALVRAINFHLKYKQIVSRRQPSRYCQIQDQDLPSKVSGKTDTKNLSPEDRKLYYPTSLIPMELKSDIENEIATLWREKLQLGDLKLSLDDRFDDLGGTSIHAGNMLGILHNKYPKLKLNQAMFLKEPTIRHLVFLIQQDEECQPFKFIKGSPESIKNNCPTVLIHSATGATSDYDHIVNLWGADKPLLISQSPSLTHQGFRVFSIVDWAAYYIEKLRKVKGFENYKGHIHFVGYSGGGAIAYEMASQWQKEGEATVCCIDTPHPSFYRNLSSLQYAQEIIDILQWLINNNYQNESDFKQIQAIKLCSAEYLETYQKNKRMAILWHHLEEELVRLKLHCRYEEFLGLLGNISNFHSYIDYEPPILKAGTARLLAFSETQRRAQDDNLGWSNTSGVATISIEDADHHKVSKDEEFVKNKILHRIYPILTRHRSMLQAVEKLDSDCNSENDSLLCQNLKTIRDNLSQGLETPSNDVWAKIMFCVTEILAEPRSADATIYLIDHLTVIFSDDNLTLFKDYLSSADLYHFDSVLHAQIEVESLLKILKAFDGAINLFLQFKINLNLNNFTATYKKIEQRVMPVVLIEGRVELYRSLANHFRLIGQYQQAVNYFKKLQVLENYQNNAKSVPNKYIKALDYYYLYDTSINGEKFLRNKILAQDRQQKSTREIYERIKKHMLFFIFEENNSIKAGEYCHLLMRLCDENSETRETYKNLQKFVSNQAGVQSISCEEDFYEEEFVNETNRKMDDILRQSSSEVLRDTTNLFKEILKKSLTDIFNSIGQPDFRFSIIGVKKLASDEITPYSSITLAFICDVKDKAALAVAKKFHDNVQEVLQLKLQYYLINSPTLKMPFINLGDRTRDFRLNTSEIKFFYGDQRLVEQLTYGNSSNEGLLIDSIIKDMKGLQKIIQQLFTLQFSFDLLQGNSRDNILIHNLKKLLDDVNDQCSMPAIIDQLAKFGEADVSLKGFLDTSRSIMGHGMPGFLIAHIIYNSLKVYAEEKDEIWLKNLLKLHAAQLNRSIKELKQKIPNLLIYREDHSLTPFSDSKITSLATDIEGLINCLRTTSPYSAYGIFEIQRYAGDILDCLYQEELQTEYAKDYLDRITELADWSPIIDPLVNSAGMWWMVYELGILDKNKIKLRDFDREKLSYDLVRRLYNRSNVNETDTVVRRLVDFFKKNGGDELYYLVAKNGQYNGGEKFSRTIKEITGAHSSFYFLEKEEEKKSAKSLGEAYLKAAEYVQELWLELKSNQETLKYLPLQGCVVIVNRAFIEFFVQTIDYFFMPYMMPRDAAHAIPETLKGILNIPKIPKVFLYDIPKAIRTNGLIKTLKLVGQNIANEAKYHPTRTVVKYILNGKIFGALSQWAFNNSERAQTLGDAIAPHSGNIDSFSDGLLVVAKSNQHSSTINTASACLTSVGYAENVYETLLKPIVGRFSNNPYVEDAMRGLESAIRGAKDTALANNMAPSVAAADATYAGAENLANWLKATTRIIEKANEVAPDAAKLVENINKLTTAIKVTGFASAASAYVPESSKTPKNTDEISTKLRVSGLNYHKIPYRGHCVYRAVAHYLQKDITVFRNEVADRIEQDINRFHQIITNIDSRKNIEKYVDAVREGKEWADNLEIAVLMAVYDRPIVVIESDNQVRNTSSFESKNFTGPPIFVYYNYNSEDFDHYDGLILADGYDGQQILTELLKSNQSKKENSAGAKPSGSFMPPNKIAPHCAFYRPSKPDSNNFFNCTPRKSNEFEWYTDEEISLLTKLEIVNSLGGYVNGMNFRLAGFNDSGRYSDIDGKQYIVFMTEAVDVQAHAAPLAFFLDKTEQPVPDVLDDRRDVFDEIACCIRNTNDCDIKILFPFNITNIHWMTCEIKIHKSSSNYKIVLLIHDPKGIGGLSYQNEEKLYVALGKQILKIDSKANISYNRELSSYSPRQLLDDDNSCGVVTVEDIVKRIAGESLSREHPYSYGATELRNEHIELVKQSLPVVNASRKNFLTKYDTSVITSNTVNM